MLTKPCDRNNLLLPGIPGLVDKTLTFGSNKEFWLSILIYPPDGKYTMMQGGIGSVRLKPREIEGQNCWLGTATSDGYCHSGIPLAIPDRLINNIDFNFNSGAYFSLKGKIIFLEDFFQEKFFCLSTLDYS